METELLNLRGDAQDLLREWREQLFDFGQIKTEDLPDDHEQWENFARERADAVGDAWCSYALMVSRLIELGGRVWREDDMLCGANERIGYGVVYRHGEFSIHT